MKLQISYDQFFISMDDYDPLSKEDADILNLAVDLIVRRAKYEKIAKILNSSTSTDSDKGE